MRGLNRIKTKQQSSISYEIPFDNYRQCGIIMMEREGNEMDQINLFEVLKPRFRFTHRPIRLFEAFAGIGCQALAFKRIGVPYEHVGISEIDKYAIMSYEAIHGVCKNYGDITKMTEIPECDVFTYSFPCTDLSKAGQQKGLQNGTRSGLVYEVLRLLNATKNKPTVLIMENVVDLVQTKFIREFQEIQHEIEQMGYTNYTEVLNAKDYGVAQNRERVFMVSILGDWYYEFPVRMKLEKRLKDYLEDNVDEKYYLTDEKIAQIASWNAQQDPLKDIEKEKVVSPCLTARGAGEDHSGMVLVSEPYIAIHEATQQGYALAQDVDSVNLSQPNSQTRRGRVGKGVAQTLVTSSEQAVVVEEAILTPKRTDYGKQIRKDYEAGNIKESRHNFLQLEPRNDGTSNALTTVLKDNLLATPSLRIRKLTPLECWRLMGIDDADFHKAQAVVSNSQLYKQAGNGIVVDVFAYIIKNLL